MSSIAVVPGFGATGGGTVRRPSPGRAAGRSHAQASHAVRLTRRGRLVLLLTFVAVMFALLTVFGDQSAATRETGVPVETRTLEVAEGDTLWEIAASVAAPGDVREMVHQIEELNALPSAALVEGQEIAVPVG